MVTDYLKKAGLDKALDKLGFTLGRLWLHHLHRQFGPAAGTASPRPSTEGDLVSAAVISGNRNFEGRVHPQVRANYLASPMLVVAYALAGSVNVDLTKRTARLRQERQAGLSEGHLAVVEGNRRNHPQGGEGGELPQARYGNVFDGDANWKKVKLRKGQTYRLGRGSTYVKNPPYFEGMALKPGPHRGHRRARAFWRCSAIPSPPTTSRPAGSIKKDGPAGSYLIEHGVDLADFNSYGSRRGNDEVMERGTFANIRIRNEMLGGRKAATPSTIRPPSLPAKKCRSSMPRCATRRTACPQS